MARVTDSDRLNLMLSLVVYLLRQDDEVPLAELAAHFKVPEPTIRRVLSDLGVSGLVGYGPDDLFELDYDRLDEGYALLLSSPIQHHTPRLSTRQAAALSAGLSFLERLPGVAGAHELEELRQILAMGAGGSIDAHVKLQPGTTGHDIAALRKAISEGVAVSCNYRDNSGAVTERTLEPVLLESRGEQWYLRAYCRLREGLRTFRVSQMHEIAVTAETIGQAAREARFDENIYTPEKSDLLVSVEADPEGFKFIRDFDPGFEIDREDAPVVRATIHVGLLDVFSREVARYGGHVRVLEPTVAREAVKNYALRLLGENPVVESGIREE